MIFGTKAVNEGGLRSRGGGCRGASGLTHSRCEAVLSTLSLILESTSKSGKQIPRPHLTQFNWSGAGPTYLSFKKVSCDSHDPPKSGTVLVFPSVSTDGLGAAGDLCSWTGLPELEAPRDVLRATPTCCYTRRNQCRDNGDRTGPCPGSQSGTLPVPRHRDTRSPEGSSPHPLAGRRVA